MNFAINNKLPIYITSIGYLVLPQVTPGNLYMLAIIIGIDMLLTTYFMSTKVIDNDLTKLFYLVMCYYTYAFPLNIISGVIDTDSITIINRLIANGMIIPDDFILFTTLSLAFKNIFILQLFNIDQYSTHSITNFVEIPFDFLMLTTVLIAFYLLYNLSALGYFGIGFQYICIIYLVMISKKLIDNTDNNFSVTLLVLLLIGFISFFTTRSRLSVTIVYLYYLAQNLEYKGWLSIRTALLGLLTFSCIVFYAAFRDEMKFELDILKNSQGIEALGEAGNIFLVGSHLVGDANRNHIPSQLNEGMGDKLLRIIPFLPEKSMLADRYLKTYDLEVGAGGGLAYPLIAELYIYGHILGIVIGAILIGQFFRLCMINVSGIYVLIGLLMVFIGLMRREISLTVITWLYIFITFTLLRWLGKIPTRYLGSDS